MLRFGATGQKLRPIMHRRAFLPLLRFWARQYKDAPLTALRPPASSTHILCNTSILNIHARRQPLPNSDWRSSMKLVTAGLSNRSLEGCAGGASSIGIQDRTAEVKGFGRQKATRRTVPAKRGVQREFPPKVKIDAAIADDQLEECDRYHQ